MTLYSYPGWTPYPLWGSRGQWCNEDIVGEQSYLHNIRAIVGDDFVPSGSDVTRVAELVPEPDNPHDRYAVSVRVGNVVVGYLPRELAIRYHEPLMALIRNHLIPTTQVGIWATDADRWVDNPRLHGQIEARVRVQLAEPHRLVPVNDPPAEPYSLLPDGYAMQVTKEDEHFDVLAKFVNDEGEAELVVTLHLLEVTTARTTKSVVEVRAEGWRIGVLTPATSMKYAPAIEHLANRGLLTAARAHMKGSAVAAKVSILAAKAHELPVDFLNGAPRIVPPVWHRRLLPSPMADAQEGIGSARDTEVRATRSGTTALGGTYTVDPLAGGVSVVEFAFSQPLTAWQQKVGQKLQAAIGAAPALRAHGGATNALTAQAWKAAVPDQDVDAVVRAVAAIEDSEFSDANALMKSMSG